MVISSLRISFIRFTYVIFWVRRPDLWESRTVCIYCARFLIVHTYDVEGYFLYEVVVDADYTDTYMYCWRLGLAGSSALAYLYVLVGCFMFRRQVPIRGRGGWLSVKQMDPVSFSAEIGNLLYITSETFRKLIKQKSSLALKISLQFLQKN